MTIFSLRTFSLVGTLFAFACASSQTPPSPPESEEPGTPSSETDADEPADAVVQVAPTAQNQVNGELQFRREGDKIRVTGSIAGLTPGAEHGFHIHEVGDCSAPDGSSAGSHFNPTGHEHGRQGHEQHHLGDMDNLKADQNGRAVVDQLLHGVTLGDQAETDILNRSVIVHQDADDYHSQPTGNAGARLACGVIEAPQK